jgi:signal transduction histidine kinase
MTVMERAAAVVELLPRPLDPVRSVKLKISILLLASGAAGLAYLYYEYRWQPPVGISLVTVAIVLLTAQVLAHGMTRPLRAMTAATRAMAQGDYSRRVRATSRDEVGQLAVAFNQMAADLAAADLQRRELIANVSHELRTPIAALQAVLENLVDGVATADPATLSTALSQTQRLGRLVAELLDLSRIDAGAVALDLEPVPVAELVGETVAEAEVAARVAARGVGFTIDIPPRLVARVDRNRVHQVLVNLLDNAARHSPPGGVVSISVQSEGSRMVVEVSDEGPGIAPEDATGCSTASRAATARSAAAPGWGSPSPAGRWTCTAARSSSPSPWPGAAAASRSPCPGWWRERRGPAGRLAGEDPRHAAARGADRRSRAVRCGHAGCGRARAVACRARCRDAAGDDAVGYRDGGGAGTHRHVRHRDADGRVSLSAPAAAVRRPLAGPGRADRG